MRRIEKGRAPRRGINGEMIKNQIVYPTVENLAMANQMNISLFLQDFPEVD